MGEDRLAENMIQLVNPTMVQALSRIFLSCLLATATIACSQGETLSEKEIKSKREKMLVTPAYEGSWQAEVCRPDDAAYRRSEIVMDYNNRFVMKVNLYRDSICTDLIRTAESQIYQVSTSAQREQLLHIKVVTSVTGPATTEKIVFTKVFTIDEMKPEAGSSIRRMGVKLIKSILQRPGHETETSEEPQETVVYQQSETNED